MKYKNTIFHKQNQAYLLDIPAEEINSYFSGTHAKGFAS